MQYSPKLKRVMEEIKDILSREDLAGVVVLHDPGFVEFVVKIDPTYSCAKIKDGKMTIIAKASDFGGDKDKRNKLLADTANMLHGVSTVMGKCTMNLMEASKFLDGKLDARHDSGGFSVHTSQNN